MPRQKEAKLASETNLPSGNKVKDMFLETLQAEKKSIRLKTYEKLKNPPRRLNIKHSKHFNKTSSSNETIQGLQADLTLTEFYYF